MTATLTSREFNQDTARAKREAAKGPVFITDRGKTTHVLLSVAEFERIRQRGPKKTIAEMLYWPGAAEIEFPLPERSKELPRDVDFG